MWYLTIRGKKTGPFTMEQLKGLHADGEIPDSVQVTSEDESESFIMGELFADSAPTPPTEPEPDSEGSTGNSSLLQKIPARPSHLLEPEPQEHHLETHPPSDADETADLFDTLQAAKERTAAAAPKKRKKVNLWPSGGGVKDWYLRNKKWVRWGGFSALGLSILAAAAWAALHFLVPGPGPQETTQPRIATHPNTPPPQVNSPIKPAPVTKPVAPPPVLNEKPVVKRPDPRTRIQKTQPNSPTPPKGQEGLVTRLKEEAEKEKTRREEIEEYGEPYDHFEAPQPQVNDPYSGFEEDVPPPPPPGDYPGGEVAPPPDYSGQEAPDFRSDALPPGDEGVPPTAPEEAYPPPGSEGEYYE